MKITLYKRNVSLLVVIISLFCSSLGWAQTITTGSVIGSPFEVNSLVNVPYTISGTYTAGNIFTVQLSDAAGSFASPVAIGTSTSTTAGSISAIIPSNTASGNGYKVRVVSSTPAVTGSTGSSTLTVVNANSVTFQKVYTFPVSISTLGNRMTQLSDGSLVYVTANGYLVKSDAYGNIIWTKQYSETHIEGQVSIYGDAVQQTSDGGFIVAFHKIYANYNTPPPPFYNHYKTFLVKTDASGNMVWSKIYGDNSDNVIGDQKYTDIFTIRQTLDGGYLGVGKTAQFTATQESGYVLKVSSTGVFQWSKLIVGAAGNDFGGIDADAVENVDGSLVIVGNNTVIKLDASGNTVWSKVLGGGGITTNIKATTGGYFIGVSGGNPGLIKIDANGAVLFSKNYVSTITNGSFYAKGLNTTSDGGAIMTGYKYPDNQQEQPNVFLLKVASDGTYQWAKDYGQTGSTWEEGRTVIQTADGGYVISGAQGQNGSNLYIIRTDANGLSGGAPNLERTLSVSASNLGATTSNFSGGYAITNLTGAQTLTACSVTSNVNVTISSLVPSLGNCNFFESTFSTVNSCNAFPITVTQVSAVTCFGGSDGSATATPGGGTSPYAYHWSNGQTTQTISGLSAGNYTVTVTDNTSASQTGSVNITQPLQVSATYPNNLTPVCAGNPVTLTASNATTYTWAPSGTLSASTGTSVTASPTVTTTYTVTGTTGACSNSGSVIVTVYQPTSTGTLSADVNPICPRGGSQLRVTGAVGNIQWQSASSIGGPYTDVPGATTAFYNVSPVTTTYYRVKVQNGACATPVTSPTPYTLTVHINGCGGPVVITQIFSQSSDCGLNNGYPTLQISGGDGSLLYSVSITPSPQQKYVDGSTNPYVQFFNSAPGNYTVTAYDVDNPTDAVSKPITILGKICLNYTPTNASSDCSADGDINVTPTGGTGSTYNITLSGGPLPVNITQNGVGSYDFTGLLTGFYTISVDDASSPNAGYGASTSFGLGSNGGCSGSPATPSLNSSSGNTSPCYSSSENYYTESGMSSYHWEISGGSIQSGGSLSDYQVNILWSSSSGYVRVWYIDGSGIQSSTTEYDVTPVAPDCTDPNAINYNQCFSGGCQCNSGYSWNGSSCIMMGCTNSTACNYNSGATQDDGSCTYPGCNDPSANNYNPSAGCSDGSCTYTISGCTNSSACNYNSSASQDDGSCTFPGCTDPSANNYNSSAGCSDGSCTYNPITGCTNSSACNYNSSASMDDGSCTYPGCTDPSANNYNSTAGCSDGSCTYSIGGCTNFSACNYNSSANFDDGSCTYPGCTNSSATNYNPSAGCDDGSCTFSIGGCTTSYACNYNSSANYDDGSCTYPGCTNPSANNYNSSAGCDDGSCTFSVGGCTNFSACNYNSSANYDDGSCTYPGCTDPSANNYNSTAGCSDGSCTYNPITGCTTSSACNYNSSATQDDGSCTYPGCTDPSANNYNSTAGCSDGSCTYSTGGCTNSSACNYNSAASFDNGSCTFPGCTDPSANNYNSTAGCSDGSCTYNPIMGCTNFSACNYNSSATSDDGSCTFPGCTNSSATNYNPSAGCDNGSCTFSTPGCTNVSACNYNSSATSDDGSCTLPGCTDPIATNYNSAAGCSDGSCVYAVFGCTNATACNYNPSATNDDGSCINPPSAPVLDIVDNCGNSTITATGVTGTLTWSDAGNGNPRTVTSGSYTVTQNVAGCESVSSNSVTAAPLSNPGVPNALTAGGLTSNQFTASWNAVSGATVYFLDVATDNGFTSFVSGYNNRNVGSVTSFNVTSLSGATAYYYRVRSSNTCATSTSSNTIQVTTLPTGGCNGVAGGTITPVATVICTGGTLPLSLINAVGGTRQWQVSADNIHWSDINGATSTSYTTAPATQKRFYRCLTVSPVCFNISSTTAVVDISAIPVITITNVTSTTVSISFAPFGSGQYNISWSGAAGTGSAPAVTSSNYTIGPLANNSDLVVTVTPISPSCGGVNAASVSTHTLCATPTVTNVTSTGILHGFKVNWVAVSGAGSYRVYYRDLSTTSAWSFVDTTGTSKTISVLYAGHTFAVFVRAKDCPSIGNLGDASTPTNYVTTNPLPGCNPPPTVVSSSACPNQIHVDISGTPPPYNIILRRISPSLTAGTSYPISTGSFNITIGAQYAGSTWEVFATKNCGAGGTSTISNISLVTVKPGCPQLTNVVVSNPTCFGFSVSWNSDDCAGLGISGYQLLVKKNGSASWVGYPVGSATHAVVGWLPSDNTYNVEVMSVACNGAASALSNPDTIATLHCGRVGDNPEDAVVTSGNAKESISIYPNPTQGQFSINLNRTDMSEAIVKIELVNQLGQVVETNLSQVTGGRLNELINTPEGLASGIYFVRTSVDGNVYVNRLMISKE